jgi:hypothetical protein
MLPVGWDESGEGRFRLFPAIGAIVEIDDQHAIDQPSEYGCPWFWNHSFQ